MSTAIVQRPQVLPIGEDFDQQKIDLIKRTVASGATNDELALFLHQCRKTGLDPLARQIYFVKRQGKGTIQTGIDGYRLVADRTGAYAGNDDPEYDDPEGIPKWAKVTVWKMVAGQRCPFTATARWSQYYPGDSQGWAWKKMPHLMLGKCAEALALRKAFPAELSGVYTTEEMQQADKLPPEGQTEAESVREYDKAHMGNIAKAEGWTMVEGRITGLKENKGILFFDLAGVTAFGDPKILHDLEKVELGDEVSFACSEAKTKKKAWEIRDVGVILKPTLEQKLIASVEMVQDKHNNPTDTQTGEDVPF